VALKELSGSLVARYLEAKRSKNPKYVRLTRKSDHYNLDIDSDFEKELEVLKSLTKYYVISNPVLMQQQRGQKEVLRNLYEDLYDEAKNVQGSNFPKSAIPEPFRGRIKYAGKTAAPLYRSVSDMIASLTEQQTLILHRRLRGWAPGSLQNSIIG
jgi:dGTPase